MIVEIAMKISKHIKKQLFLLQLEMQEVFKTKRKETKKFRKVNRVLVWAMKYRK